MVDFLYPKYYLSAEGEGEGGGGEDPGAGGEESGGGDSGDGSDSNGSDIIVGGSDTIVTDDYGRPSVIITPQDDDKKEIKGYFVNLQDVPIAGVIRPFKVYGVGGSKFNFFAKKINASNVLSYYNFEQGRFTAEGTSKQITIPDTGEYNEMVNIPTDIVNNNYYFEIVPIDGTTTTLGRNKYFWRSPAVKQYVDTDVTFSLSSAGSSGSYNTLPSDVVSSGLRGVISEDVSISWDVSLSANSFVAARQPIINDFKTSRSDIYTTNGTGSSSTSLILDSVTYLVVGMALTAVESGGVSGSPIISNINENTKTVTLSVAQSWANNKEITFTGYGVIGFNLYGTMVATDSMSITLDDVTTNTSAAVSASTTVPVDSVAGLLIDTTQTVDGATSSSTEVTLDSIANLWIGQTIVHVSSGTLDGTPTITKIDSGTKKLTLSSEQTFPDPCTVKFANSLVSGIGIDNSTTSPFIDGISSLNLTLSAAQTLEDNAELTFTGSSRAATITLSMKIIKMGSTDFTTTLQLDNILTVI